MKIIHKFPINVGRNAIVSRAGATPLSVGWCRGQMCVWMFVDESATESEHVFTVHGTGFNVGNARPTRHVGTVITPDGFVWHVFHGDAEPQR